MPDAGGIGPVSGRLSWFSKTTSRASRTISQKFRYGACVLLKMGCSLFASPVNR